MKGLNWICGVAGAGLLLLSFSCVNKPVKKSSKTGCFEDSLDHIVLKKESVSPIKLDIQPSIYPLSAPSVHYEIVNRSSSSVLLGHYSISYFDGKEWKDIPLGYIFADEEIRVSPHMSFKGKAGLNPGYTYNPGKYKLISSVRWELIPESDMDTVCFKDKQMVDSPLNEDTLVILEPLLYPQAPGVGKYRIRKYVQVLLEAEFILR